MGGVGNPVAPIGILLFGGDLSGDVGDDGAVAVQLARMFRQPGEGVQVDLHVDTTTAVAFVTLAVE